MTAFQEIAGTLFRWPLFDTVLFAVDVVLAEAVVAFYMERRQNFAMRFCLSALGYLSLCLLVAPVAELLHGSLKLMSVFLLSMAFFPLCVKADFWATLFCCVSACVLQNLAYFSGYLLSAALQIEPDICAYPQSALIQTPVYLLVHVIAFFVLSKRIRGSDTFIMEKIPAIALSAVCAVVVYIVKYQLHSQRLDHGFYYIDMLFPCCDILALYILFGMYEHSQLARENAMLQQIMASKNKQYEISMHTIELVNIKYHDLKHQIEAMRNQASAAQLDNLREMEESVSLYETIVNTGNKALDVALTSKCMLCERYGITLRYLLDGEKLDFLSPTDIYSLFGNALDNAIDALKEALPEKRLILIHQTIQGSIYGLHFENYCPVPVTFRDGLPVSSKNDPENHGFGIKSIRYIAEKYNGAVAASMQEDMFRLDVLFTDLNASNPQQ